MTEQWQELKETITEMCVKGLLKDIDEAMTNGHSEWATGVYYALLELGLDDENLKKISCSPEVCLFYKPKNNKKITNGEIAEMLFPEEITNMLFLNLINFWEMPYKDKEKGEANK